MTLALRELRRRPGRFVAATALLCLVALLLLLLGGLLDGLVARSTAAIEAQRGDVLVFSATSRTSFVRSRIDADLRTVVGRAPGVASTAGIGVVQLGGRVDDPAAKQLVAVALVGYEREPRGIPLAPPPGQGYADDLLRRGGVKQGSTVYLGPARTAVTVAGFVRETPFSGQGTLWVSAATWRSALSANRPGEQLGPDAVQVLIADGAGPERELARSIDAASGGRTASLSVHEAALAQPGVKQQQGTFGQIIGVTVAIAVVVVALFFSLLTVERVGLYGVLKAIGASSRSLFAGLIAQAVVVTAIASVVAIGIATLASATGATGSLPYTLRLGRVVSSVVLLLVAAVIGCAFSLRRVLRVDPASAIGSGT